MKRFALPLFALLFVLSACSNSKDKSTKEKDDTEDTGKKSKDDSGDDEETNIQSSPEALMKGIFKAAKSGDYSALSDICAPDATDKDVTRLCGIADGSSKDQESFQEWFKTGKLKGEPTIEDDQATVPFTFGPDGDRDEEMKMVKKNKKWYIESF